MLDIIEDMVVQFLPFYLNLHCRIPVFGKLGEMSKSLDLRMVNENYVHIQTDCYISNVIQKYITVTIQESLTEIRFPSYHRPETYFNKSKVILSLLPLFIQVERLVEP